jgi:hypothetical protein
MPREDDIVGKVLSCLLSKDEQTGRWLAHCLDFDLLTSAKSQDTAWENLRKIVRVHIEHCFTFHEDGLKLKAEPHEWSDFKRIKDHLESEGIPIRTDKITLRLIPVESGGELWIRGVETFGEQSPTAFVH